MKKLNSKGTGRSTGGWRVVPVVAILALGLIGLGANLASASRCYLLQPSHARRGHDPHLNSYRVVFAQEALTAADELDDTRGTRDQPLLGVPVAVKDDVDVEGSVTTWGTSAQDRVAATDAPIVRSLRDAGAIIVGKTTCTELVVWPFTETPAWGATRNPWNTEFSPGGSSGGSGAAVAAGLCGLATGSDGLGSIRSPRASPV